MPPAKKMGRQLTLDLGHRPALSGDDFLVAPSNAEAVGWIDAWPDWPSPAVVIVGPPGAGKTHLARVFMAKSGALTITAPEIAERAPAMLLGVAPALVLEDAEAAAAGAFAEPLLHLYNVAAETGRQLLLTADRPPSRWRIDLKDLASRLNATPQAVIGAPDDALIAGVLVKLFADRQLPVTDDVISFMLKRMERSFDAARAAVAAVDKRALAERRAVTVPLVKEVLEQSA